MKRNDFLPTSRGLLPALLCAPLTALASDPPGMLTVFFGLPLLVVAVGVLGVLALFRRYRAVRTIGVVLGLGALLTSAYVAGVDTWRFWPEADGADVGTRVGIILGCAVLWLCLLLLTWVLWRARSHLPSAEDNSSVRYP